MLLITSFVCVFLIFANINCANSGSSAEEENCFCQLIDINDCPCNVETVEDFNNIRVYPRLRSLLNRNYFRFFKVNLKRPCPFWADDSRCAMKDCHVKPCKPDEIPPGLKGDSKFRFHNAEAPHIKYTKESQEKLDCDDHDIELGYLNTSISNKSKEEFALWNAYEEAQYNFCDIDVHDQDAEYVDLLLNPERYTGYRGQSANRIWQSIYMENCFRPDNGYTNFMKNEYVNKMCLEKRAFYRSISGMHTSINIHLSAQYPLVAKSLGSPDGEWGPNWAEFRQKFSAETTKGEGPHWIMNLYFLYLLEIRALSKASPYLEREEFYTGYESEDWDTRLAVKDLLGVINNFSNHFNESAMFAGGDDMLQLKHEFKEHFRNITKIMDCVGCDKCKLWGKLQTQGLGTALKILFSGQFDNPEHLASPERFFLYRTEIVSLINAIGRLSTSIFQLDEFRGHPHE